MSVSHFEKRLPDVMEATGRTDQFKGRQYRCTECGALRWSVWANAIRHYPDHCPESDSSKED